MSTRILHVIPSLDWGYTEKQLLIVSQNLPRDDFQQSIFTIRSGGVLESEVGEDRLCRGENHRQSDLRTLRWIRQTIQRIRPHLVHAWGMEAARWLRLSGSHRRFDLVVSRWDHGEPRGRLEATKDAFFCGGASCEIVCEEASSHKLDLTCRQRKVNFGIECSSHAPRWSCKQQLLSELELSRECRIAAVVGDFVPHNGFHDAIWAAELLKAFRDDTCLLIVGSGPWLHRLWRFRSLVGIADRVFFVSRHQPIDQLLPHLDCFWAPNRRGSMRPAIMEALGHGVPVVATDVAGNRLKNIRENAILTFQPGHRAGLAKRALRIFAESEDFRSAAADVGWQLRGKNSPQVVAEQYAGIYHDVLSATGHARSAS